MGEGRDPVADYAGHRVSSSIVLVLGGEGSIVVDPGDEIGPVRRATERGPGSGRAPVSCSVAVPAVQSRQERRLVGGVPAHPLAGSVIPPRTLRGEPDSSLGVQILLYGIGGSPGKIWPWIGQSSAPSACGPISAK